MRTGFFKGRASLRGQEDEKSKKNTKISMAERKRRKIERAEKRRKSSHLPVSHHPILFEQSADIAKEKYRFNCVCGYTEISEIQEPFCPRCHRPFGSVEDILEPPQENANSQNA